MTENFQVKMPGLLMAAALIVLSLQPAWADRAPTPDEQARIETVLRGEGFQRWDEIELDDGKWKVDDAVAADGTKYDLKLDPETFTILERKRD
jgi:hypothetical protein